jgi:hypothetical protein
VIGQWFSPGTLVSSTYKTDCHNITEILLKMVFNTISQPTNLIPIKVEVIAIVRKFLFSVMVVIFDRRRGCITQS